MLDRVSVGRELRMTHARLPVRVDDLYYQPIAARNLGRYVA